MNFLEKADYTTQLIPGYQYLCSTMADADFCSSLPQHSYGCNAGSTMEVEAAGSSGLRTNDIYFTQHNKQREQLELCFRKCRLVSGTLDEMQLIDEISAKKLDNHHLEVVGIHVIPDSYDDGNQYGFRASELADLASSFRKLQHISIRGCFIEGNIHSFRGRELQDHYRLCYETAKQVSTAIPCGMSYLCFGACTDAVYGNSIEQEESLSNICRTAEIIRHQNDTSFYAKLLVL